MNVIQKYKIWLDRQLFDAALRQCRQVHGRRAASTAAMARMEQVRDDWRLAGPAEFPGLKTDGGSWVWSCDGLVAFFDACAAEKSGQAVALPSLAADAVWHAWLRADPQGLDAFCTARYGRTFAHQPKDEMAGPLAQALARCWVHSGRAEHFDPLTPYTPSLFGLDAKLRMPGGWSYRIHPTTRRVQHARIGRNGKPNYATAADLAVLTAAGLYAAGDITQAEFERWMAQSREAAASSKSQASSAGCGSSCGVAMSGGGGAHGGTHAGSHGAADGGSHGGDGGGSHGGDGGGSSCGSSCGGGCGGGGD